MKHYRIRAKFNSLCKGCNKPVTKGDSVLYFPGLRGVYCTACSERHEYEQRAARSMERFGNDCSYDY